MRIWIALLAGFGLVACGGAVIRAPEGLPNDNAWAARLSAYKPASSTKAEDVAPIGALFDETRRVITSQAFRRHLVAFTVDDPLKKSTTGDFAEGRSVLAHLYGLTAAGRPDAISVLDDGKPDPVVVATTGLSRDGTFIEMHLTPVVFERWADVNPRRRSCAINTIAHEMTHAIVDRSGARPEQIYKDGGYFWMWLFGGGNHIVSYTVGTVAQCSWMEEQGTSFDSCVAEMGTKEFTAKGC